MKELLKDIDFYFITDASLTKKTVIEDVQSAIDAGVKIVQYREKDKTKEEKIKEARQIKDICKGKAIFIINNDLDLAKEIGADGIHIGQDDTPYKEARKLLGNDKIIGVTAHNLEEARMAQELGADYLGVSPIFTTTTKKDAGKPAGIKLIEDIRKTIKTPIVAIGGINLNNADEVISAGAKSLVAMSAVIATEDVKESIMRFREKIKRKHLE